MSDIQRFLCSALGAGDRELAAQGLTLLGRALMDGDEHVDTAVAVSFVKDSWDAPSEFIESWPTTLRDERLRQAAWHAQRFHRTMPTSVACRK